MTAQQALVFLSSKRRVVLLGGMAVILHGLKIDFLAEFFCRDDEALRRNSLWFQAIFEQPNDLLIEAPAIQLCTSAKLLMQRFRDGFQG